MKRFLQLGLIVFVVQAFSFASIGDAIKSIFVRHPPNGTIRCEKTVQPNVLSCRIYANGWRGATEEEMQSWMAVRCDNGLCKPGDAMPAHNETVTSGDVPK